LFNSIFLFLKKHHYFTLFLALFWTIGIFIGCSMPGKDLPSISVFDHFDKVVHFTFFAIFYILWYLFFYKIKYIAFTLLFIVFLYGFGIEFYQLNCIEGRSFDVWDGVADTVGGFIAYFIVSFLNKKRLN